MCTCDLSDGSINQIDLKEFDLEEEPDQEGNNKRSEKEEDKEGEEDGMVFQGGRYDIFWKKGKR